MMVPATVLLLEMITAMQKTLDELIDRGDISTRDLDTRTMDALEGRSPLQCCCLGPSQMSTYVFTLLLSRDVLVPVRADLAHDLGDDAALAAVDRFAEANFGRITNKSGFLMVSSSMPPQPVQQCFYAAEDPCHVLMPPVAA